MEIKLCHGDCLSVMGKIKPLSVDLLATDLPYGTTQNSWDSVIPLDQLWKKIKKVMKPNGNMVFTASQPFTSILVMSNLKDFKYEIIWQKTIGSGQLSINHRPLKIHESILVFNGGGKATYNEQLTDGEPYTIIRKMEKFGVSNYNQQKDHTSTNNGTRRAKSIITIPNPRIKNGHPTQKPLKLMDYIIETYSNKNDLVLDCCIGSGTTGESCINLDRNFIGIEIDDKYYDVAAKRLQDLIIDKDIKITLKSYM